MVKIIRLEDSEITNNLVGSINELLGQLLNDPWGVSQEKLVEIVQQPSTRLYVARNNGRLVGMLTAVVHRLPSRFSMTIEDVVVDEKSRRCGIGRELTKAAISWAQELRVDMVDLTSNPTRTAAHRLYKSLRFEERTTSVYRFSIRARQD